MKRIITLALAAVMMIGFAVMVNAERTVVYATKVDKAPNMEEETPFIDESWGEPAIVINSSSPNTELYKFWFEGNPHISENRWNSSKDVCASIVPEDNDVELYYLWDNKFLYFGMKTADTEPSGFVFPYMGDGVQMWISPFELLRGNEYVMSSFEEGEVDAVYYANQKYDFCVTLDHDDYTSHSGGGAADLDCQTWVDEDGYMYVYMAIPLTEVGLNPKQNLHGAELATALLRISSRSADDRGYAGWLAWGSFFLETKVDLLNKIILVDPARGSIGETESPTTEAPATEAPATEAPATEAPATEAPATEAPATEAPATEAPVTEAPVTEAPATEAPATEAPATESPATEAPATEAPATEAPATEAPATEAPATEAPATEAPATEVTVTEPKADDPAPAEKSNTGLIIAIVAVVVVVGAGLGIVLGKKKK